MADKTQDYVVNEYVKVQLQKPLSARRGLCAAPQRAQLPAPEQTLREYLEGNGM